jgi:predicted RND superfamily exporter protein
MQNRVKNNQSLIERFNIEEETGIPKTDRDVKNLFDYFYAQESSSFESFDMENFDMSNIEDLQEQDLEMDDTAIQVKNILHRNDRVRYDSTIIRIYISFQDNGEEYDNLEDSLEFLKSEIEKDVSDYGDAEASVTGELIITLTITDSLTDSQIISTGISIILAAIVLIIAYRNPLLGVTAMIPVGITIIWVLGTMYLIGYSLNALTITITSITIGIGIDYSIHATERFRLVADKTGDIQKAMCETISHTGGALVIAALTTACGFGILAFAPIPPQQQFGVILSITIIYSLFTAILILPSVLVRWAEWRRRTKGYIVTTNGMKKIDGKWVKDERSDKQNKKSS